MRIPPHLTTSSTKRYTFSRSKCCGTHFIGWLLCCFTSYTYYHRANLPHNPSLYNTPKRMPLHLRIRGWENCSSVSSSSSRIHEFRAVYTMEKTQFSQTHNYTLDAHKKQKKLNCTRVKNSTLRMFIYFYLPLKMYIRDRYYVWYRYSLLAWANNLEIFVKKLACKFKSSIRNINYRKFHMYIWVSPRLYCSYNDVIYTIKVYCILYI